VSREIRTGFQQGKFIGIALEAMSTLFKVRRLQRDQGSEITIRTISIDQNFVVTNIDSFCDREHVKLSLSDHHSVDTQIATWKTKVNEPFSFDTYESALENSAEQERKFLLEGFDFLPTTEELRIKYAGNPEHVEAEIQHRNRLTFGPEQLEKQLKGY
jgi:NDP-sugar pyrophosphorylase family protein